MNSIIASLYSSPLPPLPVHSVEYSQVFSPLIFDITLNRFQAFGIAKMNGIAGLGGWRWIFIIVIISASILDIQPG